jgi:tetratricopeptide (TPR) repeat protein
VSPSLNWDDELPVRQAKKFFADRKELSKMLFVAMANEEEGDPRPNRLDRFEEQLEKADAVGFEWEVMRMPDENHGSVVLRAHYWGLRRAFNGWSLPVDPEAGYFTGDADDIKKHYDQLSERYGFTVIPGENRINAVGYRILGAEDFDGAIAVFRYNAELYPDAANVYDSLGEALENAGRLDEALASYSKAVENAAKIGDDRLEIFAANRDRLKAQLEEAKTD